MRKMLAIVALWGCGGGPECEISADCGGADFCSAEGDCEAVLERDWEVVVEGATTASMHPQGGPWDPEGGPPDLYAEFGLDSGDGCVTTEATDIYDPYWNQACTFYIPTNPVFLVNLWDVDPGAPEGEEFVAGYYWEGDDAFISLARDWGLPLQYTDESGTVTLDLSVWPIP